VGRPASPTGSCEGARWSSERGIRNTLRRLPAGVRDELLDLLASPPEIRADAIRQLHERPDTEDLAEVLIDLEAEPILRLGVMDALKDSVRKW
jgi:hypothetical protein